MGKFVAELSAISLSGNLKLNFKVVTVILLVIIKNS